MRLKIIKFLNQNKLLSWLTGFIYVLYKCKLQINKKQNNLTIGDSVLYKTKIIVDKHGNNITIGNDCFLENSSIKITGINNHVFIGNNAYANSLNIIIEGDNNIIYIDESFFVYGQTRLYVVDGSQITIGKDCMFSDNIELRTTDNHCIFDITTGERVNYERDIVLGNHVWIGMGAAVLKGVVIPDNCIIGAKALVTKSIEKTNCCIGGTNKVLKENVNWRMERF